FLRLPPTLAIVTNIDPEHLDHYGDFDAIKRAFVDFVEHVPFYGAAFLCIDDPDVQTILPQVRDRRVVAYGFSAQADIRGSNVRPEPDGNRFDVIVRMRGQDRRTIEDLFLPMPGRHNVQNALSAVGVALELGMSDEAIREGFARFGGVRRRFTRVGEVDGTLIIDDYGHHPVEIKAVLQAAREAAKGRVIAVCQPHRYTRLAAHIDEFAHCFNDADMVYVTPVYEAGESPIEGVNAAALVARLKDAGHRRVAEVADAEALAKELAEVAQADDRVICLGAGDITKWAGGLADTIRLVRKGTI
ncbi:MAG: Mur ligase family protein, partial [Pseudomonadota bacterium]